MLTIDVAGVDLWDEIHEQFITLKSQSLQLEHSLVSVSKWESKWCKPFLGSDNKTNEEILDYVRCMTITQNVDPNVYLCLSEENFKAINQYIDSPMTAATFHKLQQGRNNGEQVTSEIIYYWMVALNIPLECQKWHLNRLLTLVQVCNLKNQPPKKMSGKDTARRYAEINAARRKQLNSKG